MKKEKSGIAAYWLTPIALAAPFVAAIAVLAVRYGVLIKEAVEVAAKLAVIP